MAEGSLGTLSLTLQAKTAGFEKSLRRAQKATVTFGVKSKEAANKGLTSLKTGLSGMGKAIDTTFGRLGLLAGGAGLAGLTGFAVKAAADLESTKVAFEGLTGSAEDAEKIVSDLFEFSKVTPFEPDEIFESGRALMAAGFSAKETMSLLKSLGDTAAGSRSRIDELARAFAQVGATGRAELGDINKFADRGIPIYDALAKAMGVTKKEIRKLASDGKIATAELSAALNVLTKGSGSFTNAMQKQSETLNGLYSTLIGNLKAAAAELGTALIGATGLKEALKGINATLSEIDWRQMGEDARQGLSEILVVLDAMDQVITDLRIGWIGLIKEMQRPSVLRSVLTAGTGDFLFGQGVDQRQQQRWSETAQRLVTARLGRQQNLFGSGQSALNATANELPQQWRLPTLPSNELTELKVRAVEVRATAGTGQTQMPALSRIPPATAQGQQQTNNLLSQLVQQARNNQVRVAPGI